MAPYIFIVGQKVFVIGEIKFGHGWPRTGHTGTIIAFENVGAYGVMARIRFDDGEEFLYMTDDDVIQLEDSISGSRRHYI